MSITTTPIVIDAPITLGITGPAGTDGADGADGADATAEAETFPGLNPNIPETLAAINDDPKRARTRHAPTPYLCPVCYPNALRPELRHSWECRNATPDDIRRECKRALKGEQWAREKAERYLIELRRMHATVAFLKHELKQLRKTRQP
jgi:hypothetical protein